MTRDYLFNAISELTKLVQAESGYSKMIQAGDLEVFDYGRGYFDMEVFYTKTPTGNHFVRLWLGTIDDGDFGGWKEFKTRAEALSATEEIAMGVFKDMVAFPSQEELNKKLSRYGISMNFE
jgi:hypothetical protein